MAINFITYMSHLFCSIEEAIEEFKKGKPIIVVDDENRENEGDLVIPGSLATPEMVNFFITEGKGLVCTPVSPEIAKRCSFHPMVPNADENTCNFAVSVDAREGITTGISAADRALTIQKILDPLSRPRDFIRPGHVFPLNAKEGGVLVRTGHTEASLDLCKIGGYEEVSMICEIINPDGTMSRMNDLEGFAKKHDLKILTIEDIVLYRRQKDQLLLKTNQRNIQTRFGEFELFTFTEVVTQKEHVALVYGNIDSVDSPLVRVHSEDLVHDIFLDESEISQAMKKISEEGMGILVYIRHAQVNKEVVVSHDGIRTYGLGAQILSNLGVTKMKLLSNIQKNIPGLGAYNLFITECIPFGSDL